MNFNDMLKKKKKEDSEHPEVNETTNDQTHAEGHEAEALNALTAEDKLKEEISLANDKYLRLYAEFDNFRRRTIK